MKISRLALFAAAVISVTALPLSAADSGQGLTGASFLKIPVGGRLLAMAEAFTAVADDPYALAGNVAGICRNRDLEISFSHLEWFGNVDCEFFGATRSFFKGIGGFDSTVGAALEYVHVPDFPSYDDWGVQKGTARFGDYALMLGYSQKIGPLAAGLGLRFLGENSLGALDGAATFNLGLIFPFHLPTFELFKVQFISRPVDLGFLLENWGMGSQVGGFGTPTLWKFGFGFRPVDPFLLAADFQIAPGGVLRLNTGCEYSINETVFFRFGYRFFGYESDSYSMGLGGRFRIAGKIVKVDLSFAPASVLGNTLALAFSMKYPGRISDENRRAADLLYYKGIYFFTRGELDKAIEMWNEALKFDPEMKDVHSKIDQALKLKELGGIEKSVEEKIRQKEKEKKEKEPVRENAPEGP